MTTQEKKQKFLERLQKQFPAEYETILNNISQSYPTTFRINLLKYSADTVLSLLHDEGYEVAPCDLDNSYIVISNKSANPLSRNYLFEKNYLYIQSLSSMLPVVALAPEQSDKVLDLCAAPGSKTLQIAMQTNNLAHIVAVDNNKTRYFRMQALLNSYDVKNIMYICSNGINLYKSHPQYQMYFDKILLDAPCSNEGNINFTNMKTVDYWHPRLPKKLAKLQKSLLYAALYMLRLGGTIVYSTCTLSIEENEEVIAWALSKYENLKLIESRKVLPNGQYKGFYYAKLSRLS